MSSDKTVQVNYYEGFFNKVDKSTKNNIEKTLHNVQQEFGSLFFDGLNIHVATTFSKLDEFNITSKVLKDNSLSYITAPGAYDIIDRSNIFLQEFTINLQSYFIPRKAGAYTNSTLLHEIGHYFDNFFGCDKKTKEKYDEIIQKNIDNLDNPKLTKDEEDFMKNHYYDNDGYNDNEDFKTALYEDLQHIDIKDFSLQETYYIAEFYNNCYKENGKPTLEDINLAESSRKEIFAQLFAYAMNANDSDKESFLKKFPTTFNVVKTLIEKHSVD